MNALLRLRQYAAQDIQFHFIQTQAAVEPAQARHQLARRGRIEKPYGAERLLQVRVEALHILLCGRRRVPAGIAVRRQGIAGGVHMQFVGDNLHRHGQIQRAIRRAGGNGQMQVAAHQLGPGQTVVFAPEQHGHLGLARGARDVRRGAPGVQHRPGDTPILGAGRDHQATVGDGLIEAVHHARVVQHLGGAHRAPGRLRVRELPGRHQHQPRQAHVFHGPRGRPDIAGVAGLHENDADAIGLHKNAG